MLVLLDAHNAQLGSDVLTHVTFNYKWRQHVHEALCRYFLPLIGGNFESDDAYTTWQNFAALLEDLYTSEPPAMTIPVGTVIAIARDLVGLDGWLTCDGTHYTADDYPELNNVIHASLKDATGFFTPNLKERFILGEWVTGGFEIGDIGGASTVTLTEAQLPTITPQVNVTVPSTAAVGSNTGRVAQGSGITPQTINAFTEIGTPFGGDEAHENMPPYLVLLYVIKAVEG